MAGTRIEKGLDKLGFDVGSVSEAILSTVNQDGSANASPMGILRVGPKTLEIRPFRTSTTYRNLLTHSRACINVTSDPSLYLITAFKRESLVGFPKPSFKGDLRLDPSDAYVFIDVISSRDVSGIRTSFECEATSVEVCSLTPRAFSRGRAEAIEAIVYATRIKVFLRHGRRDLVERLIKRFRACKDVVARVSAPESKEVRVVKELERLISSWRERESR